MAIWPLSSSSGRPMTVETPGTMEKIIDSRQRKSIRKAGPRLPATFIR